jgi:hypothetical protein
VSAQLQAAYDARLMLMNLIKGIPITIVYQWRDGSSARNDRYGLVTQSFQPRPAYNVVRAIIGQLAGTTYQGALSTGRDFVLVFRDGAGNARLAVWTTAAGHNVTLKPKGKRYVIPRVSGTPKVVVPPPGLF